MKGKYAEERGEKKKRKWLRRVLLLILIIIIILLLLRRCGPEESASIKPVGDYNISDFLLPEETQTEATEPMGQIIFTGSDSYTVTQKQPAIVLENHGDNTVDMVYTLTDMQSEAVVARTEKILPGKFVYINVMDFYKEKGVYDVHINIATYDSETGEQKNGLDYEAKIYIK